MMKNTKEYDNEKVINNKGITLIALVITIIVLLILAGVSIATLTGDNGILTKAQTAKEETQKASEEEQRQLAMLNASMNTKIDYYTTEDKDGNTTTVPIPAGFAPTGIEGENTVKDGFVITDENGNEFVWIPCGINEDKSQKNTSDGKINYNAKRSEDWKNSQECYNGGNWGDEQPNKGEIKNSIKNNGGFYIARYEAGVPENAPFYASKDGDNYYIDKAIDESNIIKNIADDKYKPVSKKGVPAWSFISQVNAKKVAENMIKNNGVQSYLVDSHAWDTACRVIEKYASKKLTDSIEWGNFYNNKTTKYENLNTLYAVHNYTDSGTLEIAKTYSKGQVTEAPKGGEQSENRLELSTGASEDFKAYNIYDLAGNMHEWTTENGENNPKNVDRNIIPDIAENDIKNAPNAVFRGCAYTSIVSPVSVTYAVGNCHISNHVGVSLGFRVVLYIQ